MDITEILDLSAMIIGWVILICVCCYSIPQFITVIKTKNTKGLSIPAYVFFIFSSVSMFVWGIGNAVRGVVEKNWEVWHVILVLLPNVLMNGFNTTINTITLILKIKYFRLAKKKGIDEYELSQMILAKQKKKKASKRKVGK